MQEEEEAERHLRPRFQQRKKPAYSALSPSHLLPNFSGRCLLRRRRRRSLNAFNSVSHLSVAVGRTLAAGAGQLNRQRPATAAAAGSSWDSFGRSY